MPKTKTSKDNPRSVHPGVAKNEFCSLGYIGTISAQLAQIARTDGYETLARLLEMAVLEADTAPKDAIRNASVISVGRFRAPAQNEECIDENRRL